jgi:hypothetical protein
MYHTWTMYSTLQQRAAAVTVAGAVAGAIATLFSSAPATAADTVGTAAIVLPTTLYSVINLGPESGGTALLNERGQAAFNSFNYYGTSNGFFDGDRVSAIGRLGGNYTTVRALNNLGVVVGSSEDGAQPAKNLGFTWTAPRMRSPTPSTIAATLPAITPNPAFPRAPCGGIPAVPSPRWGHGRPRCPKPVRSTS